MDMEAIIGERETEKEKVKDAERERYISAAMEAERNVNNTQPPLLEIRGPILYGSLVEAAMNGDTNILACANNFVINYFLSKTVEQENIIHIAVKARQLRFIKEALDIFPSLIHHQNIDGNTPLHVAACQGDNTIISVLISHLQNHSGTATNNSRGVLAMNLEGDTPFHVAIKNKKLEAATIFCRECTVEEIKRLFHNTNHDARTPLHLLALHCYANDFLDDWDKMVTIYSDIFICADDIRAAQDIDGNTALHLAIQSRNFHAAKLLVQRCLESKEKHEMSVKNNRDHSVFDLFAQAMLTTDMGQKKDLQEMMMRTKRVIKEQALVERKMDDALYKAVVTMDSKEFRALKRRDGDIERGSIIGPDNAYFLAQTVDGSNIIHIALQQGKRDGVGFVEDVLDSFPALIFQADSHGDTPIHLAAKLDNPVSEAFLKLFHGLYEKIREQHTQGVLAEPWKAKNSKGNMPIHEALRTNNAHAALELFAMHSDAACFVNNLGETPLHVYARCSFFPVNEKDEVFERMIAKNISAAYARDKDGLTPLLRAAKCGRFKIVLALLKHCPQSAYIRDSDGKTFLHLLRFEGGDVAEHSADRLFKLMGEKLFDIPEADAQRLVCDSEGNTPLHHAIKSGNSIAAEQLVRRCLKTEIQSELSLLNDEGETVIDLLTSYEGPNEVVDLIRNSHPDLKYSARTTYGVCKANIKDSAGSLSIIAGLLATITFAAAFQVPGGFDGDSGSPVFSKRVAFQVFMVSDAIAVCSSMLVLFMCLWIMGSNKTFDSFILLDMCFFLLQASFYATLVAFMTGVYVATATKTRWLGVFTCTLCSTIVLVTTRSSILFLSQQIRLLFDMRFTVNGCSYSSYRKYYKSIAG